jgi:hypothetical protein
MQEMPFVSRYRFYSALTPRVTRMLDDMFRERAQNRPEPEVTNSIEAGEPIV